MSMSILIRLLLMAALAAAASPELVSHYLLLASPSFSSLLSLGAVLHFLLLCLSLLRCMQLFIASGKSYLLLRGDIHFKLLSDLKGKWDGIENKSTVFLHGGGAIVAVWLSSILVGAINFVPLVLAAFHHSG